MMPKEVPGIPAHVLNPRESWADKAAYDATARQLVALFEKNFESFAGAVDEEVKAAAVRAAA
jgi:phosphoenolpyruvate carboxykinase (ATP)